MEVVVECTRYTGVIQISGDYDKEKAFVESLGWTILSEETYAGYTELEVEGPALAASKTEEHPNRLTATRNWQLVGGPKETKRVELLGST